MIQRCSTPATTNKRHRSEKAQTNNKPYCCPVCQTGIRIAESRAAERAQRQIARMKQTGAGAEKALIVSAPPGQDSQAQNRL